MTCTDATQENWCGGAQEQLAWPRALVDVKVVCVRLQLERLEFEQNGGDRRNGVDQKFAGLCVVQAILADSDRFSEKDGSPRACTGECYCRSPVQVLSR